MPSMLHTLLHAHIALTWRTNGRNLGKPSKSQCSFGNHGAMDRQELSLGLYVFKEINCVVCWICVRTVLFPCVTAVFLETLECAALHSVLVVQFRQSLGVNVQGVEKVTRHSMLHKRRFVSSHFCATLCVKAKQFLCRTGQAPKQQEAGAHGSSRKSMHEDGSVVSLIVMSWYLLYYSGHEISGPYNKSAHTFPHPDTWVLKTVTWYLHRINGPLLLKIFLQYIETSLHHYPPYNHWLFCSSCCGSVLHSSSPSRSKVRLHVPCHAGYHVNHCAAALRPAMEERPMNRFRSLRCCKARLFLTTCCNSQIITTRLYRISLTYKTYFVLSCVVTESTCNF